MNIFEPRYLAMVQDSLQTQTRLIGMVQPRVPNEEDNIGAALDNLSDEDQKKILKQRYLDRMTMVEIGEKNGYSRETARRAVNSALAVFEDND